MTTIKRSKLKQIIKEEVRKIVLKEGNELLKAQSNCKVVMFKIKKDLDVLFKKLLDKGIFTKIPDSRVIAWDDGYRLDVYNIVSSAISKDNKVINPIIYKNKILSKFFSELGGALHIHPDRLFQTYFDTDKIKDAGISAATFGISTKDPYITYKLKDRNSIKTITAQYYNTVKKDIDIVSKELDKF